MLPSSSPLPPLATSELVALYVASGGILSITLDKVNKQRDIKLTESDIISKLSEPAAIDQLQRLTRVYLIMQTFELANAGLYQLKAKLGSMAPADLERGVSHLLQRLGELTTDQKTDINVNNFIWENVIPDEAREAIDFLKNQRVIDHIQQTYPSTPP